MVFAHLLALGLASSKTWSHGQTFQAAPNGIILSAPGDNGVYGPLFAAASKVNNIHLFNKFENDLLVQKHSTTTFLFVKKSFPPYARLRYRQHVLQLFLKVGIGNPFSYEDLVANDFENFAAATWRYSPNISVGPGTKLAFMLLLRSSTNVNGKLQSAEFAPAVKLTDQARQSLLESPAKYLTSQKEIQDHLKDIAEINTSMQVRSILELPLPQETNLAKLALDQFQIYYDNEVNKLDSKIDETLPDATWANTKLRRKATTMRQLKEKSPKEYDSLVSLCQQFAREAGSPLTDDDTASIEQSPLSNQYIVNIVVFAGGKRFDLPALI